MQAQRQGSNIKTEIRVALSMLKRDPYIKLPRSIAELKEMRRKLHAEAREAGLLKPGY
ncbi:MAG: hypothetical protein QNJ09_18445 [Paracoccaceae bacterium]|nr:hypothetical protein [Paracoccaceae bacterium]